MGESFPALDSPPVHRSDAITASRVRGSDRSIGFLLSSTRGGADHRDHCHSSEVSCSTKTGVQVPSVACAVVDPGGVVHDVYAYGVIAPSTLVELSGAYPAAAGYGEIVEVHPSIGGEAAGGAFVLARLGVSVKLSGTRLGNDPESRRVVDVLTGVGVDCTGVAIDAAAPVAEMVVAAEGERTVFGTYGRMLADRSWVEPSRDDIDASRLVCLDPFFGDASAQAAVWCVESSVPYVTVDTDPGSEIAQQAAAIVVSGEYALRTFGQTGPHAVFGAYADVCDGLVVITRGGEDIFYGRRGETPTVHPAFEVDVRDTTGAGDGFRAGIAYGLLREYDDDRTIEMAAALAAMICRGAPGVLESPTEHHLTQFLAGAG